jgi:hypothetical protein
VSTVPTLGVVLGDQVWIAIAAAATLMLAASLRWRRVTSPAGVLRWFLQCWAGRAFALGAWTVAGWHLFCQRP